MEGTPTRMRNTIGLLSFLALLATVSAAGAFDETKYPDLKGQWLRVGAPNWVGPGQKPPLTPEYQVIFDANLADQAAGGHGTEPSYACLPPGMPRIMNDYTQMEIVVTADTTYVLIDHINDNRRIFTDGRDWPAEEDPTFRGYSIGKWIDTDGDGRYDTLEVETRNLKGPRAYDTTGLPLHSDNQTVVKERIYLDKADGNLLHDDITTIDHALTGPWTVAKTYRRSTNTRPSWVEMNCAENNQHIRIGTENYFISAEGLLMPAKKDQAPPDLRYFKSSKK
jgi:hypothetical protein